MKKTLLSVALMFAAFSVSADTSLADAIRAQAATAEWRLVAKGDQCFQQAVVDLAVRTMQYQTARIAELERQLEKK